MNGMYNPPHPGEVLKFDVLDELGLSVTEAAHRLGVSRVALSRVVNAKAAISPSLAWKLELAGVSSARAWLAMQSAYDLWQERNREHEPVQALRAA